MSSWLEEDNFISSHFEIQLFERRISISISMSKCLVAGCRSTNRSEGITFHRFPKDKTELEVWASNLSVNVSAVRDRSLVCSTHFRESDFVHTPNGSYLLRDAIPIGSNQPYRTIDHINDDVYVNLTPPNIYSEHSYSIFSKSEVAVAPHDRLIEELQAERAQCMDTITKMKNEIKMLKKRFPKDKTELEVWASNLSVNVSAVRDRNLVCSTHFRESDFVHTPNGSYLLRDAIPIGSNQPYRTIDHINDDVYVNLTPPNIYSEHSYSIFSKSEVAVAPHDRLIEELQAERAQCMDTITKMKNEIKMLKKRYEVQNKMFGNLYHLSPFLQEIIIVLLKYYKISSYPNEYSPEFRLSRLARLSKKTMRRKMKIHLK
ncbi:hypothetical protein Bhyg_07861 [Pseudolycoriella hygida]|uniref:THAP-type domain-containing protein n=1 Tax=Pseudolycoriella hygida TaxID=35572 RepID=A0A9Q0N3K0_9DIPT|nr:hypothetical protein Bhyg_07861 [Pseudolycoriella hygida]